MTTKNPPCDGDRPKADGGHCNNESVYRCVCKRCDREDPRGDDPGVRFNCCAEHRAATSAYHERVFERPAQWAAHPRAVDDWEEDNRYCPDGDL